MKALAIMFVVIGALLVACGGDSASSDSNDQRPTGATASSTGAQPVAGTGSQPGGGTGATTTAVKLSGTVSGDMRVAGLTCQPNDAANVLVSISGNVGQGKYTVGLTAPGRGTHPMAVNASIKVTESSPGFKVWAVGGPVNGSGSVEVAQNMRSGRFQGTLPAGTGASGTVTVEGTWTCP